MSRTASFERVLETLRCSIYDHKNEQLLNFHIITTQIPTCKAPNRFQESYDVKYFKVIKRLKSLQKAEAYFEPKRASMTELFCEAALRSLVATNLKHKEIFGLVCRNFPDYK